MLDFEAVIETGQQIIQQISFNLQHISSVLSTELFDPFEVCFYRGGNYWELESADEFSGDDEFIE
uniref:Non-structural protein 3b n=1 Tax=Infectious bronchitis virus TaxID=11120 RepID=K9LW64_9GAMC|nr:3b protein [Infectious bronchitis virus]ARS22452.1 3b protein [Infectious bronchitis virus]